MPHPRACPDDSALWRFLQDQLATADAERVDDHLGGCPACQQALDRLIGSLPGRWLPAPDGAEADAPTRLAVTAARGMRPRVLMTDVESGGLPGPPARPGPPAVPPAADLPARLQLLGEIARGGMGAIFEGRDVALGRDLAVKVLLEQHRHKPELIRRFVREARIAGRLQHPGMVPVHELGDLADGRPYFAMKLVRGRTLEALLKERASPTDDLPRFLGIFEAVCQAVAYAHARGVIHRDLKPANVMVGAFGEVQVMDWGLAKVLDGDDPDRDVEATGEGALDDVRDEDGDQTQPGSVLGTWSYMPPEQARGLVAAVDRRSDVFGLGATLAEILTGRPPYVGPDSMAVRLQAIAGRLDEASARLEGCGADAGLIRLAAHCLAPEKADRPADGGAVAAAVAAYLAGVQERLQEERLARERQEVRAAEGRRRHRVLAAAALGVLLALALGVVASTIFALGERAAREKATHQALMAEESLFLLGDVLSQADPTSKSDRDITLRAAVDRMIEKLDQGELKEKIETPESNARVRIALGKIYFNLGEYRRSRDLFAAALRIASAELGESHPTAMTALDQLGMADLYVEDFADAERVLNRAYELQRKALGPEDPDTIHSLAKLGDLYHHLGKLDRAVAIGQEVLRLRRKIRGDEYLYTLVEMHNLGMMYRDLGRPADAEPLLGGAERIARRTVGDQHPYTVIFKCDHALVCADLGRREEALGRLAECLDQQRKALGDGHLSTLKTEHDIATVLFDQGHPEESRRRSESILRRLGTSVASDHSFRGKVLLNLGGCLTAAGEYPEAERVLREARAILLKKGGPENRAARDAARALGGLAEQRARADGGRPGPRRRPPTRSAAPALSSGSRGG